MLVVEGSKVLEEGRVEEEKDKRCEKQKQLPKTRTKITLTSGNEDRAAQPKTQRDNPRRHRIALIVGQGPC